MTSARATIIGKVNKIESEGTEDNLKYAVSIEYNPNCFITCYIKKSNIQKLDDINQYLQKVVLVNGRFAKKQHADYSLRHYFMNITTIDVLSNNFVDSTSIEETEEEIPF